MADSLARFRAAYGEVAPPARIRQQPLDGDPGHYARLCAAAGEALAAPRDLADYADDLAYQPEVQPDLFAYLLPRLLAAWRHDQIRDYASDYTAFAEVFVGALARRPLLETCLAPAQADAVRDFMRAVLLERIDAQFGLSWPGKRVLVFPWIMALNSHAVLFPDLAVPWRDWWRFSTPGRAVAALQYASCLMYPRGANPILAPPTPRQPHQTAPDLWASDGQVGQEAWRMENLVFFMDTVTPEYLEDALARAARTLAGVHDSPLPVQMLADFPARRPLVAQRLAALPDLLALANKTGVAWPPPA